MPYVWQQFVVGVVLLALAALDAVWASLLTDFDALVKPNLVYTSSRNLVLVATLLVGNIIFMSLLKVVTLTRQTQGPVYAGALSSQALVSSALVTVAFYDAWQNNALYAPYYSQLSFGVLKNYQWQLAAFTLSWATTGFVLAIAMDHKISDEKNDDAYHASHEAKKRPPLIAQPQRSRAPPSAYHHGQDVHYYVPQPAPLSRAHGRY
jgi:hypothetical protein